MITLKFKKLGWFADEDSARYEAIVNENVKVWVYRQDYTWQGFTFRLLTSDGYDLDGVTGDCLSTFWTRATKKQAIKFISDILNDAEELDRINKHAIYVKRSMS